MKALKDSQREAIEKLSKYKVGALFMEAGTGKTLTAYLLAESINPDYVLWFTPFQVKDNLRKELSYSKLNIDIVGIESFSNSNRTYLQTYNKIKTFKKPFIICDESLKIKNEDAKRTQRIIELSKLAEYKLILNGTPVSKNLLDIWAQMEFLSPKILGMGHTMFKNSFIEYTVITKQTGNRKWTKEFITNYHNVEYLFKLIEPFIFEADLDLKKKKQYIDLEYSLSEEEQKYYKVLKEKYLDDEEMEARNNNIFLLITQKLQHSYSLSAEKLKIINKIIDIPNNFIIFAKYIETQERLKELFPNVLVLSWQKHSFGLNLQKYNRIIFFDKVWDYALVEQAEHRVYRLGQQEDCIFYQLNADTGLDKMMQDNIDRKGDLLRYFKNKSVKQLMKKL